MKFVFIAPRFHTNFYYQVKTLMDNDHEVEFLSLYEGGSEDHSLLKPKIFGYSPFFIFWNKIFNPNGGRLIKNMYELRYGWPPIFSLFKTIKQSKADVLVIKDIVTAYSLIGAFIGKILGKKIIFQTQIPKFRKQAKSGAVSLAWSIFGAYVTTPVLGDKNQTNENENFFYLPFVAVESNFDIEDKKKKDEVNILCVGKFQARKNQRLLLEAVNNLKKDFRIKLILVGQEDEADYFKELKFYIHENNLENIVDIVTDVSWSGMNNFYRQADIFVLPSFHESAAYSVLEAMSFGLPILSSDDNGTKCYVSEGENGFIFNHKDTDDLTKRLKTILSDRNLLLSMSEKSLELTETVYSPDSFYAGFMDIVNKTYGK